MEQHADNARHYFDVAEVWQYILGVDFHVGWFDSTSGDSLEDATRRLIDRLAEWCSPPGPGADVLDVGCGIGGPACYLARKFSWSIKGITLTEKERSEASRRADRDGLQNVRFFLRDATDNRFLDQSFDLVWQLESSHLIRDKERLFRESFRVLRPGGRFVLCDFFLCRTVTILDIFAKADQLAAVERAFGRVKSEEVDTCLRLLEQAGFENLDYLDVTNQIAPTIDRWRANLDGNESQIRSIWHPEQIRDFASACEAVEDFFRDGFLGYGFLQAQKPGGR